MVESYNTERNKVFMEVSQYILFSEKKIGAAMCIVFTICVKKRQKQEEYAVFKELFLISQSISEKRNER